jgi:nucleoside-diphosphate-sugar epimerase
MTLQNHFRVQTILGGGGAIGSELAKSLKRYTDRIRIVNRNPKKINPDDELMTADLANRQQVFKAIENSDIVYVTIGFEYKISVWKKQWPSFIRNVIDACIQNKAKLVFFDNVYMYDKKYLGNMTEDTPVNPSSRKGKVRAQVAQMITDAYSKGELNALIARSADFYGPGNTKSVLGITVFDNFKKGKAANWFARADKIHTFTFTPDAAKAVALLGNTPDAYNQVWHLPTHDEQLTGKKWIELIAGEMKVKPKYMVIPEWLLGVMGLFMPIMRELKEMVYQYKSDYVFNSSKFQKRFGYLPVHPIEGIQKTLEGKLDE